ncbi:hypothetical protein R1sor_000890 [Riccia sorocarpa]|uniref:Uncharacterized protein n=1 Tax=Riccia sorocarpa TaxID=122646 RepID=A0ABD3GVA8_9MARC
MATLQLMMSLSDCSSAITTSMKGYRFEGGPDYVRDWRFLGFLNKVQKGGAPVSKPPGLSKANSQSAESESLSSRLASAGQRVEKAWSSVNFPVVVPRSKSGETLHYTIALLCQKGGRALRLTDCSCNALWLTAPVLSDDELYVTSPRRRGKQVIDPGESKNSASVKFTDAVLGC